MFKYAPNDKQFMPEAKEQDLQRKYLELQMLGQKMQQVQQQAEALEEQAANLDETTANLSELSTVKTGTEILVPVANGIFVKATIKNTNTLLVNVGAHVNLEKPVDDVKTLVSRQAVEIRKLQEQLASQLKTLVEHAQKTEGELQKLAE